MTFAKKVVLIEVAFFIGIPILSGVLHAALGFGGDMLAMILMALWGWELFAYLHYRYCRQEEFIFVLQMAANTQAPIEQVLRAYLNDRPREHLYRGFLLFFVFPGYYWIHIQRSFDLRLSKLMTMLEAGVPLGQALAHVPGVVSNEVAMAVTVGEFSGKLTQALQRLPDRRSSALWIELAPRLLYPLFLLGSLLGILSFLMIFIIPKFEKIFLEFKLRLPSSTEFLIDSSRSVVKYGFVLPLLWLSVIGVANVLLFSSYVKWHVPLVSWLYRMHIRGQFLQSLGLMLETGKPLPEILGCVLESKLLPSVLRPRVQRLAADVQQGQLLASSLARHGLATASTQGLIASAEKAHNLPWALQELGDSMVRRSGRLAYQVGMVLFPLAVIACAGLVALVALGMFEPLVRLIEGINGK